MFSVFLAVAHCEQMALTNTPKNEQENTTMSTISGRSEVLDAIKNRSSIRKYQDTPISDEEIHVLLEAAMYAPSALNLRPWHFIVIKNRDILEKISHQHNLIKMLKDAPAGILICATPEVQEKFPYAKGFYQQDCSCCAQNILLQASSMGLGACWCSIYPKEDATKAVSEIMNLPANEIPFCIIALGHPNEKSEGRGFYEEDKVKWVR